MNPLDEPKTIKKSVLLTRLFIGSSCRLIFNCNQGDCTRCLFDNGSPMKACNAMAGTIGVIGKDNCNGAISAIKNIDHEDISYNDFLNATSKYRSHGN